MVLTGLIYETKLPGGLTAFALQPPSVPAALSLSLLHRAAVCGQRGGGGGVLGGEGGVALGERLGSSLTHPHAAAKPSQVM